MAARITVAQLAEQVDGLRGSVAAILEALQAQPAAEPQAQEAGGLVPLAEGETPVQKATAKPMEAVTLTLDRQADRSRGGAIRFWTAADGEAAWHGSVYVTAEPSQEPKSKQVTVELVAEGAGQANLDMQMRDSGRPKVTKGRVTYGGRFSYDGAEVQVYVNTPKAKGQPRTIGFNLGL